MKLHSVWKVLGDAAKDWQKDKCARLGAALSFYTFFSLAPILVIAIAIAGFFFGAEAARGQVVDELRGLIGTDGAVAVQLMLENAWQESSGGVLATLIAVVIFLLGATGAFIELQGALNSVWLVMPKPGRGVKAFLMNRLISFGMIIGIAFLLLVSLIISAGLTALSGHMSTWIAGIDWFWQGVDFLISFVVITLLFAMIFKALPDVRLELRDVFMGAAIASLLFMLGKFFIGLYIGNTITASSYGAAGGLVVILIWVFYSAQIMLYGAEVTEAYVKYRGRAIIPAPYAFALPGSACAPEEQKKIVEKTVEDVEGTMKELEKSVEEIQEKVTDVKEQVEEKHAERSA